MKRRGFTLIELLVAMSLLTMIVLGLLAVFDQTQKAFTSSMSDTDLLENGRAAMDIMGRDLELTSPSELAYINGGAYRSTNFYTELSALFPTPFNQTLPGAPGQPRANLIEDFFFISRVNQDWVGTGYAVINQNSENLGTLYRFSVRIPKSDQLAYLAPPPPPPVKGSISYNWTNDPIYLSYLFHSAVTTAQHSPSGPPFANLSRVADGVIHLRLRAYNPQGQLLPGSSDDPKNTWTHQNAAGQFDYYFCSNAVPACLELELGILESQTLQRYRGTTPANQATFLGNQAPRVHLFQQRIPIRNLDTSAY